MLLCSLVGLCSAAELSVVGVTMPVYDDATGRLLCRIEAAEAAGSLDAPCLLRGVVKLYAADAPDTPAAVLEFDRAVWNRAEGTIADSGPFRITSDTAVCTGTGYCYRLATAVCEVLAEVRLESTAVEMSGRTARLRFCPGCRGTAILAEAVLEGDVVATPRDSSVRCSFERAAADRVRYDATAGKLHVSVPARVWTKGQMAELSSGAGDIVYDLGVSAEWMRHEGDEQ